MLEYETNYAKDNQACSRAYLFNFLPFYHSGVRLTLRLGAADLRQIQNTALVGGVWWFGTKDGVW